MSNIEMKVINFNPDLNRVITLVFRNGVMFFALVVKRQIAQGITNYCVYLELSEEEYNLFAKQPTTETKFSFFGISSVTVNVPKEFCDSLMKEQPNFFIGNHHTYSNGHKVTELEIFEMIRSLIISVETSWERINGRG